MPLLDRNYLGLLQLVPGVAINRAGTGDAATPVLGERGNNAYFLIDGMPNRDELDGGDAVPFSLDSILEMQVLTSGYRAEFGRGSGGIVNAATKSGTKFLARLDRALSSELCLGQRGCPGSPCAVSPPVGHQCHRRRPADKGSRVPIRGGRANSRRLDNRTFSTRRTFPSR